MAIQGLGNYNEFRSAVLTSVVGTNRRGLGGTFRGGIRITMKDSTNTCRILRNRNMRSRDETFFSVLNSARTMQD